MKDEVGGRRGLNHKVTKSTEGWGRWGNFNHEIHGNHERGEAPESAASAVVFLSASGWAWVEGKPPILLEEAEDLSQRHQVTKGG